MSAIEFKWHKASSSRNIIGLSLILALVQMRGWSKKFTIKSNKGEPGSIHPIFERPGAMSVMASEVLALALSIKMGATGELRHSFSSSLISANSSICGTFLNNTAKGFECLCFLFLNNFYTSNKF